jgi:hypothetical protein
MLFCCRIGGNADPQDVSSADPEVAKRKQAFKSQDGDDQKVHRCNAISEIARSSGPPQSTSPQL